MWSKMASRNKDGKSAKKTPETIQEADDVMNGESCIFIWGVLETFLIRFCFFVFFAALYDISTILDTGLDRETLSILVGLCETGVNPEALAAVVKELQREAARINTEV